MKCFSRVFQSSREVSRGVVRNLCAFSTGYVTTPIFYVNGPPHIGHAFSVTLADVYSRWFRLGGHRSVLRTGTDEHGPKIHAAAMSRSLQPLELANNVSNEFRQAFRLLNIEFFDFIRTTETRHKETVISAWNALVESGLVYKGTYKGWYCLADEEFLTSKQVKSVIGPDGIPRFVSCESERPVEEVEEVNYMFKMSLFKDRLRKWLEDKNNPVIVPASRLNSVLATLESEELGDLSVSRYFVVLMNVCFAYDILFV